MRDNKLKYILIISLVLNVSFLGAAGYTHYKQTRYRPAPFGYGVPAHGPLGGGTHLFQELALKPDQLKAFQEKALPFHAAIAKKKQEVDRLRTALFGLMRADNPDQKAIEATIAGINKTQEEMQKMVVAHMLECKGMLNKDQQQKFLNMIEGAMGQRKEAMCP
ncbi:MAG TPA: periplasmic heavy metal sensor [Syntrophorhabdales bacterium]|nr:periplasmic heavy metal sensor [Syntrophorhabdales bacterium]